MWWERPRSQILGSESRMKSLSASIIVFTGAILILRGAHISHGGSAFFVQAVGFVLGLIGLGGWVVTLKEK